MYWSSQVSKLAGPIQDPIQAVKDAVDSGNSQTTQNRR